MPDLSDEYYAFMIASSQIHIPVEFFMLIILELKKNYTNDIVFKSEIIDDIGDIFISLQIELDFDEKGDIIDMFIMDKISPSFLFKLLNIIAPFIDDDSYIEVAFSNYKVKQYKLIRYSFYENECRSLFI